MKWTQKILPPIIGITLIVAIAFAGFQALIFIGNAMKPPEAKAAVPAHDAEPLCRDYGGVREIGTRTFTVRATVQETGISAYCNDGSYVSRSVTGKP